MYNEQNKLKKSLENEIKDMAGSEAVYMDYLANKSDYDLIKNYYDSTVNDSEALYTLILDLEKVMPKSVGISSFTVNNGAITLTGISGGKEPLADFVIELKKLPYVSNVRVQNISDTYDEFDQVISTYNMSFNISISAIADETAKEAEGGVQ